MTDKTPNACDRAIERQRAAMQALADYDDEKSAIFASHMITGKPTLDELLEEVRAASAAVDEACKGKGPSR